MPYLRGEPAAPTPRAQPSAVECALERTTIEASADQSNPFCPRNPEAFGIAQQHRDADRYRRPGRRIRYFFFSSSLAGMNFSDTEFMQ